MTDESTALMWDVHVAPPEPLHASDLAPGEEAPSWSPISATLISGERDAVLIDALLTAGQAQPSDSGSRPRIAATPSRQKWGF